jgi:hypothetical protein
VSGLFSFPNGEGRRGGRRRAVRCKLNHRYPLSISPFQGEKGRLALQLHIHPALPFAHTDRIADCNHHAVDTFDDLMHPET